MTNATLTLTDFLLARIAEDNQLELDEWALRGMEGLERAEVLSVMRKTALYQWRELSLALRRVGWALVAIYYPRAARRRAAAYADHPDYREEWRP